MPKKRFPEGKTIRKTKGGLDSLKGLLLDLRKYSFTGYVQTILDKEGKESNGYVFVKSGNLEGSYHVYGQTKSLGKAALRRIWKDSADESCHLEVHAKIDVDAILSDLKDAKVRKEKKPSKAKAAISTKERNEYEEKLGIWRDSEYDVSSLEEMLDAKPQNAKKAFEEFEHSVRTVEVLRGILESLDVTGFEDEAEILKEKMKYPSKHVAIEAELQELQEKIEKTKEDETRKTIEEKREKEINERARQVFEMIVKHKIAEGKPVEGITESQVREAIESKTVTTRDISTNLISQFSFDSFVVGPSNRFANAAALAVAKSLHEAYNPLFITSGPGLGKTHLLNAIGNTIRERNQNAKVLYVSTESFANEFKEAPKNNRLPEFREKFRSLDLLLIDDVHFLSGRIDVQEELFHTFNALYNAGKQIALTSDRPPKEIPDLEDRLISRFESGLIADIQPPDFDTRLAILTRKVKESGIEVDTEVLNYIAHIVETNIRELNGALNRVLAFSSLMGQTVSPSLAKEVLKDLATDRVERRRKPSLDQVLRELNPGRSYLVEEDKPVNVFRLLAKGIEEEGTGLVITRTNPKRVRERYGLRDERILWLTDRESTSEETMPPVLERLIYTIEEYMRIGNKGAVMLDGMEYLISNNSFEAVLRFLRRLVDHVSESHFILLISISPKTVKEQELKILEREMEVVQL